MVRRRRPERDDPGQAGEPVRTLLPGTGTDTVLAALDPGLERVVECRFFAGMTLDETAGALQRPKRSVERDWARAYLFDALAR